MLLRRWFSPNRPIPPLGYLKDILFYSRQRIDKLELNPLAKTRLTCEALGDLAISYRTLSALKIDEMKTNSRDFHERQRRLTSLPWTEQRMPVAHLSTGGIATTEQFQWFGSLYRYYVWTAKIPEIG